MNYSINNMSQFTPTLKGRFRLSENVRQELRDKDGNIKPLFAENALGQLVLRMFRRINPKPITPDGQVKPGLLNYLSAYGVRISFITGIWSNSRFASNLVTTAGKAGVASRVNGSGGEAAFIYIANGLGTTAANIADTTLESEILDSGLERASATVSRVTTDTTDDTARLINTFSVTGTKAITESGVLNASSSGTLLARQVFSAVNVVSGDSFQVTWSFDID